MGARQYLHTLPLLDALSPQLAFGVGNLFKDRLRPAPNGQCAHRNGPNGQPKHGRCFCRGGQGISSLGQSTVNTGERTRNVQAIARRPLLGFHADGPHTRRQLSQLIRNLHELVVELVVVDTLKDLVVPVQSAVKAIVGAAPEALTQLKIVLPPLPDGPKETHDQAQRY